MAQVAESLGPTLKPDAPCADELEAQRRRWLELSAKKTAAMAKVEPPPKHFPDSFKAQVLADESYIDPSVFNSDKIQHKLARDGYVAIKGLFSPAEVELMRTRIHEIVEAWPDKSPASCFADSESTVTPLVDWAADKVLASGEKRVDGVRRLFRVCLHDDSFRSVCKDKRLTAPLQRLWSSAETRGETAGAGTEGEAGVALLQSMCLLKPPGTGEKRWHADQAYFRLRPSRVFAYWIALDDTNEQNGCMFVQPGSHQRGLVPHGNPTPETHVHYSVRDPFVPPAAPEGSAATTDGKAPEDPPPLPPMDKLEAPEDSSSGESSSLNPFGPPVAVPMRAGDALLFHGDLIHGTPANRTKDKRRRALQLHYAWAGCVPSSCSPGEEGPSEDEMQPGAVLLAPNEVTGPDKKAAGSESKGGEPSSSSGEAAWEEKRGAGEELPAGGAASASGRARLDDDAKASDSPAIDGAGPLAGAGRFAACIESQHWYYRRAELLAAGSGGGPGSLWPA